MLSAKCIRAHYRSASLIARVEAALGSAGLNAPTIDWTQLAAIDQFQLSGVAATALSSGRLDLARDAKVIDLDSGLGGPARHLAAT